MYFSKFLLSVFFCQIGVGQTIPGKASTPLESKPNQAQRIPSQGQAPATQQLTFTAAQVQASADFAKQPPPGAGTYGPSIPGLEIWADGKLFACESIMGKDIQRIVRGKPGEILAGPPQGRFADIHGGFAYFWIKETKGDTKILRFLRSTGGKDFENIGTFEESHFLGDCKALDNGLFLLRFVLMPVKVGDAYSFLIKAKLNEKGAMEPKEAVELDLDLFDKSRMNLLPTMPFTWIKEEKKLLWKDLAETKLLRVGDFLVLPLAASGKVFVFKAENGNLVGSATLFPTAEEHENRNKPLERAILCYRPTPDGDLILATRTEDAVLNSRSIYQQGVQFAGMDSETYGGKLIEVQTKAIEAFPEIIWWRFDPSSRIFTRIPAPDGMPAKLKDFNALRDFTFWVNCDGRVVSSYDQVNPKIPEKVANQTAPRVRSQGAAASK